MSGLFAVCGSISADLIGYAPRLPGPGASVLGDRFLLADRSSHGEDLKELPV